MGLLASGLRSAICIIANLQVEPDPRPVFPYQCVTFTAAATLEGVSGFFPCDPLSRHVVGGILIHVCDFDAMAAKI